jgi:hypothetical protein
VGQPSGTADAMDLADLTAACLVHFSIVDFFDSFSINQIWQRTADTTVSSEMEVIAIAAF